MEIFVISTREKDYDIRIAFVNAIKNLVNYEVEASEMGITFCNEANPSIKVEIIIPGLKNALRFLDSLYNDREQFFRSLGGEVFEELFKHLVFANRICDISYYLQFYPEVALSISDHVLGEKFNYSFLLK